jgi:hypothetical protein
MSGDGKRSVAAWPKLPRVAAAEKRQLTDFKCVQMKREQPK